MYDAEMPPASEMEGKYKGAFRKYMAIYEFMKEEYRHFKRVVRKMNI